MVEYSSYRTVMKKVTLSSTIDLDEQLGLARVCAKCTGVDGDFGPIIRPETKHFYGCEYKYLNNFVSTPKQAFKNQ